MKMTKKQIAIAEAILNEDNLKSLGFKNVGKTADRYFGTGYQYKDFRLIRILDFMSIKTLELDFPVCSFVSSEDLEEEGLTDVHKQYKIYDMTNEDTRDEIDIHSNDDLMAIVEKWADAIKKAGAKKTKRLETYYNNL